MVEAVFSGILLLAGVAGFVLTGAAKFGFAVIAVGLWLGISVNKLVKKNPSDGKKTAGRIIVAVIITALGLSTPPINIHSENSWQLPFQKAYIGFYKNVRFPDFFPDTKEVEEHRDFYRMEYSPSIMQGTGFVTVSFTCDKEYAAEVAERFSGRAAAEFPLLAYTDSNRYYHNYLTEGGTEEMLKKMEANDFVDPVPEDTNLHHDIMFDKYFSESAVVYMLDDNRNFNHPHSSAVIVDTEAGAVEFVKYG